MKKWSLRYAILKNALLFAFNRFYRSIDVMGVEDIPEEDPVIFAENHTNAVLDPILTATFHNRQPGFLTRSDVFANSVLDKIFRGFKMIPVYRQRDGVNTQIANKPIFNAVVSHLKEGGGITIAPEGDKGIDHHLLPLKKGGSRIAIQFMEETGWEKPLYIVPVGITYGNYMSHRSELLVRYGKPFLVNDFRDDYNEKPNQIFGIVTERLAREIKKLTWNVEDEKDLPWLYRFKNLDGVEEKLSDRMDWALNKLGKTKQLPESDREELKKRIDDYLVVLSKKGILDRDVKEAQSLEKKEAIAATFILSPFAFINLMMHQIPLRLSYFLVRKMNMHPHFETSLLFGFAFIIFPFFYLIYFILMLVLTDSLISAFFIIMVGPVVASISEKWHSKWRSIKISGELRESRESLMDFLRQL